MSLFGDDSPVKPTPTNSNTLFDDESASTSQKKAISKGSGLFADGDTAEDTSSPWGNNFTPKKQARSDLLKTLLPGDTVPESYIDAFDTLVEEGYVQGSGVSKQGVLKLLDGCNLGPSDRAKILNITGAGNWEKASFVRGEFNVLLALIGLAREGEEVSLDSVDERRKC